MTVSPIPAGYPRVSPYLIVDDADGTLAFMLRVFDGESLRRHTTPDGRIMHAEVRLGDAVVMVGAAGPEWPAVPAALHIYVTNADETYRRAVAAGAVTVTEPTTQPYGDRSAYVRDVSGTTWFISTHVEDVSDEELARRMSGGAR